MKRDLTRKQFLGLGVGLAAFAIGCGGDDSGGDDAAGTGGSSGSGSTGSDPTTPDPSTTAPDPTTAGPDDTTTGPNPTTGTPDDTTGGSDDTAGSDSTGATADTCGTSFDIHPHTLEVPADDVVAGTEKMYVAGGGHTHDVVVTAADFAELAANGTVQVMSGPSGMHSHVVTITCR